MSYKLCAVVSFFLLHDLVFGSNELDTDFPNIPNYWYNISGVISGNMTFACSIMTNSKPTVIWMNEGNLLTDLWKENNQDEVVFSFNSWGECMCNEGFDSEKDSLGFSTFKQATVSFSQSEILHSTCRVSRYTQETNVFWENDLKEVQESIIPHNTGAGNNIFIAQMQIQTGSKLNGKVYTCNISDVILINDIFKTDEKLQTATLLSSNYRNNCSSNSECISSEMILECNSEGYCDCVTGYVFDSSDSRCEYNYYLNITVAAIAFSVLLGLMFLIWCATMVVRSYKRRPGINSLQQNPGSLNNADSNLQVINANDSASRINQPSLDLPPAYLEIERSETPPPSFESIYSIELKMVKVDNETFAQETPMEDIYAICGNETISEIRNNSEIKIDT